MNNSSHVRRFSFACHWNKSYDVLRFSFAYHSNKGSNVRRFSDLERQYERLNLDPSDTPGDYIRPTSEVYGEHAIARRETEHAEMLRLDLTWESWECMLCEQRIHPGDEIGRDVDRIEPVADPGAWCHWSCLADMMDRLYTLDR